MVAELWPCLGWKMQTPSRALCQCQGCVLQLNPGLEWALEWGRHLCTPHWHSLGHQWWVQTMLSLTHMRTGTLCHGDETPQGPALGWTQSSAMGSPLCGGQQEGTTLPVPTSTPPSKPKRSSRVCQDTRTSGFWGEPAAP